MTEQECPSCHTTIPADPRYVMWCAHCGWNLQPQEPPRPRNVFESFYASMGKRFSQGLFSGLAGAQKVRPRLTGTRMLAFLCAALVHAVTFGLAIAGVVLLVKGWPNVFAFVGGLFCLGVAAVVRPRMPKMPRAIVPRERYPTLYKLADDVARALGAPPVYGIVIDDQFNAAFGQAGWRRRPILRLGLPLLAVLGPEERVALVAHELAHGVNGDPRRGFFTGTAVTSLIEWYSLLRPERIWDFRNRHSSAGLLVGLGGLLGNALSLALSSVAWVGAYALSHLLWYDSQRAEYLADHLAAGVGGTRAMLSALDKLHLSRTFSHAVRTTSLGQGSGDIFHELAQLVAELPERELERIRRVELLEMSRLDVTHPPTAYRVEFLKAHYLAAPKVALSRLDMERIDAELAPLKPGLQARLIDRHRRSLYY